VVYDGKRWLEDKTGEMMRKARRSAREIYQEAARAAAAGTDDRAKDLAKWASRSLYLTRLNAMITIAESILPAQAENFDRDLYMLAVQNGLLDLRTGELQPHDPECYITKIAGANYDPDAKAPTWLAFLDKVFNSDRDVIAFIQRAVGYSLTGDVGEQCLFFLYGIGANGKSTFTGTVQRLLGDYAMKTRAETLMTRRHDTIPEEVAQLAGVRFMLAAELGEGQRLNEGLIKDLTGGDAIRGRFLYRKSFEFYPVAKPWLYGNHKPTVRGSDEGIWRRVKLIPFEVVIPESQRDPKMPEKLAAELDGILAWAVEGCLEWQRSGLRTPESIKAATKDYRQEQDILADFKADCCYFGPNAESVAGELYEAYSHYAGKQAMSQRAFSQRILELEGVSKGGRNSAGRQIYKGIGLLEDSKPDKVQAEQIPFDPNYDPDDQEHPEEITEA
jgi:putative DNA primase/helicase